MTATATERSLFGEIAGYWHGEGPLWRLYWVYGVLVSTLGGIVLLYLTLAGAGVWVLLPVMAVGFVYTAWLLVGIWRCAFNVRGTPLGIERETWGWIARLLTFGWVLNAGGGSLLLLQMALGY